MTANRKFKQAVRARMAETGESYSVAASAVRRDLSHADGPVARVRNAQRNKALEVIGDDNRDRD